MSQVMDAFGDDEPHAALQALAASRKKVFRALALKQGNPDPSKEDVFAAMGQFYYDMEVDEPRQAAGLER